MVNWAKVDPLQASGVSNPGDLKEFDVEESQVEDPMDQNILRLNFPDVVTAAQKAIGLVTLRYKTNLKYPTMGNMVCVDLYDVIDNRLVAPGGGKISDDERTYKIVAKRLLRPTTNKEISLMRVSANMEAWAGQHTARPDLISTGTSV